MGEPKAPLTRMGLFSSKRVVYVASVAYNMAGPATDRLNVLKSTVSRHVLLGEKKIGLGQRISETQMSGPTMDQRAWFRWTKTNYTLGATSGRVANRQIIPDEVIQPFLVPPAGHEAIADESFISPADATYWAEEHILNTRPADIASDWVVDLDFSTGIMRIQYEDLTAEDVTVTGFTRGSNYVIAYYRTKEIGAADNTAVRRIYRYRIGSGNPALDALYVPGASQQEFFPAIPLRINNLPISHSSFDAHFPTIARAYKKATGQKIDEILKSIEDNDNIGDVDYATLVFGVELTTKERCGLRYLYEFFKSLIPVQGVTPHNLAAWCGGSLPDPMGPAASLEYRAEPASSVVRVNGISSLMAHNDMRLNWVTIKESIEVGLGKPDAKVGDLWFLDRPGIVVRNYVPPDPDTHSASYWWKKGYTIPHARLYWQDSQTSYRVLDIYGMVHQNFVYGGKAVELTTSNALSGVDEEGFIVPLHYPTLLKMPLVMTNQLALSSRHVVFNCYQIVRIRWYQRGIFKILIGVIIGIVTAFVFPGAVGLLGTALQVGTFLGFSGMSAIIVGAAVNALAAILLSVIIEKAAIAIFGEDIGRLLSSIITFFVAQGISNWAGGMGFTIDWGQLMQMDRLLGLLNATVDGVSGWIQGHMQGIQGDMEKAEEDFKSDWDDLQKKALDLLGAGGGVIDPLMFTQSQSQFLRRESRDAFLQRTLMTGSDLIDLNLSMIEDFVDLNLTVDVDTI